MNQTDTQTQFARLTFWHLLLTGWGTPLRLAVCAAAVGTLLVLLSMGKWSGFLFWFSLGGTLWLVSNFIARARSIRARVTRFERTDFGEVVYLDGSEECVDPEEIREYSKILSRIEREIALPVMHHTLVIYLRADGLSFGRFSKLFRCIYVQFLLFPEGSLPAAPILQQAVSCYLAMRGQELLHRFNVRRYSRKIDYYALGQAIVWGLLSSRFSQPYMTVASRRAIGADVRALRLACCRNEEHLGRFDRIMFMAFIVETAGLRNMVECYLKAEEDHYLSMSCLARLFGSVINLEQRWRNHLDRIRERDAAAEVRDILALSASLEEAGCRADAFQEIQKALAKHGNSVALIGRALDNAIRQRDARECLRLVALLAPHVSSICSRARLKLAEGLLHHLLGEQEDAQACFHAVLDIEPPVTHARLLAQRWLKGAPTGGSAWLELDWLTSRMLL
jgi:tetratricopeptide (TPR) repeat protein